MKALITFLTFSILSLNTAQAKVFNFMACSSEQGQSTTAQVRELLNEPKQPGNAHHVGYYELKKQGHVVGYLPYFNHQNKQFISSAYFCTNYWGDYYYVQGVAESIRNWTPQPGQTLVLKDLHNDEAVSNLKLTRLNDSEVRVDVFVRDLAGGNNVIKDVVILSLKPKKKL